MQRHTYCAVKSPNPRIIGFLEIDSPGKSTSDISTFAIDLERESRVVHIDLVPQVAQDGDPSIQHCVTVIHEDGHVASYSPKLNRELWSHSTQPASTHDFTRPPGIQYAVAISREQASKSLLKQREDILYCSSVEEAELEHVLFLLESRPSQEGSGKIQLWARLFAISNELNIDGDLASQPRLSELLSLELPVPAAFKKGHSQFSLHTSSGTLYQRRQSEGVAVYDLTSFLPRLLSNIGTQLGDIQSCLRLNTNSLAMISNSTISIVGMPFCTIQASTQLKGDAHTRFEGGNRSQSDPSSTQPTANFLSYSSQQNLLVVSTGRKVLAVPVFNKPVNLASRKRNRQGLLISSLGRGLPSRSFTLPKLESTQTSRNHALSLTLMPQTADWDQRKALMNKSIESCEYPKFDDIMIEELELHEQKPMSIPPHILSYVLGKIFRVIESPAIEATDDDQSLRQVQISFWPGKVGEWLLCRGMLTTNRIESAMHQSGALGPGTNFAPNALVEALASWDPTLRLLRNVLLGPALLNEKDIGQALSVVIRRSRAKEANEDLKLLTNGEAVSSVDGAMPMQLTNGGMEEIATGNGPGETQEERDVAKPVLYALLTRLKDYSAMSLIKALKSTLKNSEMRSLIDILRVELARNGWLSLAGEDYEVFRHKTHTDDQITLIAHALNLLLDALGPTGWMLGNTSTDAYDATTETISYMKAEVSAALEGIEEATYLQQMLSEALLCGKETLRTPPKKTISPSGDSEPVLDPVRPVTVLLDEESNLLPLSLKPRATISKTKIGAGGEIMKRSQRDIGRLKSKAVGKYTFERIEV